jgi:hypothetical protein
MKEKEAAELLKTAYEKERDLHGEKYLIEICKDPLAEAKKYAQKFNHLTLKDNKYSEELYSSLVSLYVKTSNLKFDFDNIN